MPAMGNTVSILPLKAWRAARKASSCESQDEVSQGWKRRVVSVGVLWWERREERAGVEVRSEMKIW